MTDEAQTDRIIERENVRTQQRIADVIDARESARRINAARAEQHRQLRIVQLEAKIAQQNIRLASAQERLNTEESRLADMTDELAQLQSEAPPEAPAEEPAP